ncbi:stress enhanced protein 1, chloroplastic-like [Mangifera indica]|uniref:stress enhanced protein 1, chloroplastic-like n=1 Tax=Mangifera indica TaxID=29780 RepID=UPI001CFB305E|nr:stress enhanced protein 1, chloroplastic-like [Mangifera indica]
MENTITVASLPLSIHDAFALSLPRTHSSSLLPTSNLARIGTTFATGSPLSWRISHRRNRSCKATPVSVRCEQNTQGDNRLDVWLGRLAMVGFAVAISVEIATGKGLLENFELTTPLPTAALGVTALVGVLTAVFIFQSASKN